MPGNRCSTEVSCCCFRAIRYIACVMLGVASEGLLDLLLERFVGALASETERDHLANRTEGKFITIRYDELKKRLDPKKPQLPKPIRHSWETTLASIFNLTQQQRNDASHPTGRAITRDEAYGLLGPAHLVNWQRGYTARLLIPWTLS